MVPEKSVHFQASPQTAESSPGGRATERSWKESSPSEKVPSVRKSVPKASSLKYPAITPEDEEGQRPLGSARGTPCSRRYQLKEVRFQWAPRLGRR